MARRFAKAPAWSSTFIYEIKGVSAKGGGRPAAPPWPMERPPPRGFAKRGAVPASLRGPRSMGSPYVFPEVKVGEAIKNPGLGYRGCWMVGKKYEPQIYTISIERKLI